MIFLQNLGQDADEKQRQHAQHDGADGFAALVLEKGHADVVAGDAEEACHGAQGEDDLAPLGDGGGGVVGGHEDGAEEQSAGEELIGH